MLKQNTAWHFKSKHYRKRRMNTKYSYSLMNATCCKEILEENHVYHTNTNTRRIIVDNTVSQL